LQRKNMMAANYQHIGGHENRLGRHYSRFQRFGHPRPLPINHLLCENRRTQGRMGEVGLEARRIVIEAAAAISAGIPSTSEVPSAAVQPAA